MENQYWDKIKRLQILEKNIKSEKIKKVESQKIIKAIQICLKKPDILEGGYCLYQRNKILRFCLNMVIKYVSKMFEKYS